MKEYIDQLESTGNYRVIKRLKDETFYNDDDSSEKKIAIFLDTETTGINFENDEIIEQGRVAFE